MNWVRQHGLLVAGLVGGLLAIPVRYVATRGGAGLIPHQLEEDHEAHDMLRWMFAHHEYLMVILLVLAALLIAADLWRNKQRHAASALGPQGLPLKGAPLELQPPTVWFQNDADGQLAWGELSFRVRNISSTPLEHCAVYLETVDAGSGPEPVHGRVRVGGRDQLHFRPSEPRGFRFATRDYRSPNRLWVIRLTTGAFDLDTGIDYVLELLLACDYGNRTVTLKLHLGDDRDVAITSIRQ